jgi:thioredoxin-related protein
MFRSSSLFLIIFLFACTKFNNEAQTIESIVKKYTNNEIADKRLYLVTSLDGCGACLEYTVKFIENNITDPNMMFIVSGQSKIQLKSKFSPATIKSPNFVFDTSIIALKNKLIGTVHPKIFLLTKGKIVESKEVNFVDAEKTFKDVLAFVNQ